MPTKFARPKLTRNDFYNGLDSLRRHIDKVFDKQEKKPDGNEAQLSWHENFGDLSEEKDKEYLDAIHGNDTENCLLELHDVATSAIWGISSFYAGYIDPDSKNILKQDKIPGTETSWKFNDENGTWEASFPVEVQNLKGKWIVYLIPRPGYCDRGRWNVVIETIGVPSPDEQEGFPRYFFKLDTAKSEMEEWVKMRSEIMKTYK